ncbi:hypothetical protein M513_00644 [Trichuris suis]|uniref:Uncharacterized protein n=1 Tax=Trichuris suis TaxID=68888 RepID=A0A085MMH2_9BILA|nr:hypothetical protein M513_00644 [Trichuris suis]
MYMHRDNRQAIQWSPFDKQALSQEDNATGAVDVNSIRRGSHVR